MMVPWKLLQCMGQFNDKYTSKSNFEQKLKEKLNSDTFKYNAQHWENLVEQRIVQVNSIRTNFKICFQ